MRREQYSVQRGQARQVISVLLQRLVETTRIGATGGASSSPTESERDSAGLGGLVRIGSNPHRHGSE